VSGFSRTGYNPAAGGFMCRVLAACVLTLIVVVPVLAQQPPPSTATLKTVATSADVATIVQRLKSQAPQPLRAAPLLQLAPYTANIEYRSAVANASVHDTEAELFYVIDGSATFVTGGQLADAQRTNPQNQTGKSISGGTSQRVTKGDFMIVPEGVPHWFSAVDGSITLMSIHLPRQK
jgi:mannose-6-phosphate isomerase-like protein (cupin superfamily)